MAAVRTRLATLEDLDGVTPLFDAYRQFYQRPADLPLARRYLQERMQRRESVIFVAEDESSRLVGFTQLYPTFCSVRAAPTFVLYDLFVEPQARGTGAGRALMQAAEDYSAGTGAARLELSTAKTNAVAQKLYESQGWRRDEAFFVYNKTLRS
ncbi:MAG: GNAT family N-acetyltransferase [Gammaproteobacteria bacterium]